MSLKGSNEINFKAVVRMVFKPLIDALPIVGGMELYFISLPSLDYNLGGMANFAEIPGISNVSINPGLLVVFDISKTVCLTNIDYDKC